MKKYLSVFYKSVCFCCVLFAALICKTFASEGLWPIQNTPVEQIKKELNFTPDASWIHHVQRSCVKVTPIGIPGGGSGTFVSANGLVITNRHCVVDALSELSTPKLNYVHDGMYAATLKEELPSGLQIHVLDQVMDITAQVHNEFGDTPSNGNIRQLEHNIENRKYPGLSMSIISSFGGAHYDLYIYRVYDAKLVFVPDAELSNFGGEDDNFSFPRHTLDIAFLRAYYNNEPVKTLDWFPISTTGAKDGDSVFVAGHPGSSERHLTVSRLEYLRDVELPSQVAITEHVFKALESYMQTPDAQRATAAATYEHWGNQMKIQQRSLTFLKNLETLKTRADQEQQWRSDFTAMKEEGIQYLSAFDEIEKACSELSTAGPNHGFELNSQLFGMAGSLNRFSSVYQNAPAKQQIAMRSSFKDFINHVIDPSRPIHLEVEKVVVIAWLTAARDYLPADSRLLRTMLADQTPADVANQILAGIEPLLKKEAILELVSKGANGIDDAKIPLLVFLKKLDAVINADEQRYTAAQNRYKSAANLLERGLAKAYGTKIPPDASNTLRLGWGKVCGYKERGKDIPWDTTFGSMLATASTHNRKFPFTPSERVLAVEKTLDLTTPLDFVSTVDGMPGSSGAPIFSQNLDLVGMLFDGNKQEVPSMYALIPSESGGRSIAVHSAAIWAALDQVCHAQALLDELHGKAPAKNEIPIKLH